MTNQTQRSDTDRDGHLLFSITTLWQVVNAMASFNQLLYNNHLWSLTWWCSIWGPPGNYHWGHRMVFCLSEQTLCGGDFEKKGFFSYLTGWRKQDRKENCNLPIKMFFSFFHAGDRSSRKLQWCWVWGAQLGRSSYCNVSSWLWAAITTGPTSETSKTDFTGWLERSTLLTLGLYLSEDSGEK